MNDTYWHSVALHEDLCTGCTVCMQNCPTQAIRIIDGKAKIISEKCIDCGRCITVCPFNAKTALADSLEDLKKYKYTVALASLPFYAQFNEKHSKKKLHQAVRQLGFDRVFDTSYFAEVLSLHMRDITKDKLAPKPVISTYCPAVTRLIQIKYPELIPHISKIESPMEVAARYIRQHIIETKSLISEEIGIFSLVQCPAKITSIKSPIGIEYSALDGALSIKDVFPTLLKNVFTVEHLKNEEESHCRGELWGLIGGQSEVAGVPKSIKVDGIEQVSKILDMVELGKLSNIDFLEACSCRGGCVGGPLNVENPFIAKYRIEKRSLHSAPLDEQMIRENFSYESLCWDKKILPLKILQLDEDIIVALEKMERITDILKILPRIDCGACGSPSCRALAEDIVQNRAVLADCIFVKLRSDEDENL
jgi:iron only hydrogenase large subunit-like protein